MNNKENVPLYIKTAEKHFEKLSTRDKTYFSYIRSLSQILVGLLALLIGLRPNVPLDNIPKVLFLLSLVLIGLTILFSQRLLFCEVEIQESEEKAYCKLLSEISNSEKKLSCPNVVSEGVKSLKIFEKLTFCCFGLSILSLILYSVFLYFPIC